MFLRLTIFLTSILCFCHVNAAESLSSALLCSTASDPDACVDQCVNVINGDFCETVTDLVIPGPDPLILQRFHNATNYVTGKEYGGWRLLPQTLLVLGKDPQRKECKVKGERFEWTYAFVGERSGSILTYSGWKRVDGGAKDPLKINTKDALGMVNSYAEEITGRTNHLNNRLHCSGDSCTLTLGDGTKRLYQKTTTPPLSHFNQEIHSNLAAKLLQPLYYRLVSETLPSGNTTLFTYDGSGQLTGVEIQNSENKPHSWIHIKSSSYTITLETSDARSLQYRFEKQGSLILLKEVSGSHCIQTSYDYLVNGKNCALIRKRLPEGRFLEIDYDSLGCVASLKHPHPLNGQAFIAKRFEYGKGFTDVSNSSGVKTRYSYDDKLQLTATDHFDEKNSLQRTDRKYYSKEGALIARAVADGTGRIFSYRTFKYDSSGNVLEEKLYGNLTGKKDPDLDISNLEETECHTKSFTYSQDGFNLLTSIGDCKGNRTTYRYQKGTNLLIEKLTHDTDSIRKREFRTYNEDGVCIKVVEDDGLEEDADDLWGVKERHVTYIQPKTTIPGIGLPESIEEKATDIKTKQEILVKRLVNTYSSQGQLLSCSTYGSDGVHGHTVSKTYNALGQVLSETDPEGKTTSYTYNGCGDQILISIPHENKSIKREYDKLGRLIAVTTKAAHLLAKEHYTYDLLGRKISEQDRFGNVTEYAYDPFDRLTQVIYPSVLDEYGNPVRPMFSYEYDLFGNVIAITDPKGYTTQKSYNLRGSPSKIHYPDGSSELFKYDPEGSLHRSLTRDRMITVYEYDYLGRLIYEEVMTASEEGASSFYKSRSRSYNGFRCTSTREDQLSTDYTFDPAGRVIQIEQYKAGEKSDTRTTAIEYDPLGRKAKEKRWFDEGADDYALTSFVYDDMGNLIETKIEDAQGTLLKHSAFTYDTSGRCTEENDGQTSVKTLYDPFGEICAYIDTADNTTEVLIDYISPLRKTLINPLGLTTEMEYDALSRLVSVVKKDSQGKLLTSQEFLYDTLGNKSVERNGVIVEGKLRSIQTTRWVYGPMGCLEKLIEAEGTPEEKTTTFIYNTLGKLVSQTFSGISNPMTYSYNKEGQLYKVKYEDPDEDLCISNNYSYDRQGNITSAHTLYGIQVEREYNPFGQVIKETTNDGEGKYSLSFQYDKKGRLKKIELPDHSSIGYTYDPIFGKDVIRLKADGSEDYRHTYTAYDISGRLCEETFIGYCGDRVTEYDASGRKSLVSTDYDTDKRTYDPLGHLLSTDEASYTYNALSQLITDNNNHYVYDSVDNRVNENNETLIYNSLNQLIKAAKTECSYDPLGNLNRKIQDGEETLFTHNILSQLVSIKKSDQTALYFSYDPFGRRLTKKQCDISGKYKKTLSFSRSFYLDNHELGELDKQGLIVKLRVPGLSSSSQSVAIELSGTAYLPLHDHAGNVIALLDPDSREVVERYNYSAFGKEEIYSGDGFALKRSLIRNPWRFAEKRIDEESGLIYFGLRYYDPSLGRWISQDPSHGDGPNLYAYLHNNPINYIDHVGLETEEFEPL